MLEAVVRYVADRDATQLLRDFLDVVLVYYLCYRVFLVVRGTRAMQVGLGLVVVFLLYVVAQVLELVTVLSIMGALIQSIILVIVVVFANDIRRGLQRVGDRAWFGGLTRAQESRVIDEVVEAATELARHRTGALITFEQDANLDEFVGAHKGHILDARVSKELLVSLFIPEGVNRLHDGSVIIRNYRIAKAGVFFPMPEGRVMDESFGSRHRAAMGITEETDAVVVIVSEERGTISFCFNGNIASNLDGPKLKTMLEAIFSPKVRRKSRTAKRKADSVESKGVRPRRELEEAPAPSARAPEAEQVSAEVRSADSEPPSARRPSEPPPPLRPRSGDDKGRASITPTPAARLLTPPLARRSRPMPSRRDPDSSTDEESASDPAQKRGDN